MFQIALEMTSKQSPKSLATFSKITLYGYLCLNNVLSVCFPDKPEINKTGLSSRVNSWLYHNSTLTCQAEGNPTAKITWSKDKHELSNGSISGNIRIYPTKEEEFGNYTCTALNVLGKDEMHVDVIRTGQETYERLSGNRICSFLNLINLNQKISRIYVATCHDVRRLTCNKISYIAI